jgi:hypothetical protein
MSMCLSFGGNREETIDTSVINEEPSSVRVKLKNETPSLSEAGLRVGIIGVAYELVKVSFFSVVGFSLSSSSLESGVGMPIDRTVGAAPLPREFFRDEGRLLLRIRSGNATNLTIFRAQTSALSSDNPTHVKLGPRIVTSVSSEDEEVAREEKRRLGLVGDSDSVALGEWCLELVRERVITVPVGEEWRSRSKTDGMSSPGDVGVDKGEGDISRPSTEG